MPKVIVPMLATLVDKPFQNKDWMFEVKWDGYRALAYLNIGKADIKSRNEKSFNEKFYPIYEALKLWNIRAIVDGEIVVIDEDGVPDFSALQNWRSEADGQLIYYVFDLLWFDGQSLLKVPLTERRQKLKSILPVDGIVLFSESFNADARDFFEAAKKLNLEGIMAKKKDSLYLPGKRSKEWLKIKTEKSQEVVIGGFTQNEGSNKSFSSLLVGIPEKGKLNYIGKIGTGFNMKMQRDLITRFQPLIIPKSPFAIAPDINKPSRFRPDPPPAKATWLRPVLTCEVSFREMTSDGVMRHPSFKGLREDKNPDEVTKETQTPTQKITKTTGRSNPQKTSGNGDKGKHLKEKLKDTAETPVRKTLLNPSEKSQTKIINGKSLTFSNLDKIFFPKGGYTKRDVINYYYRIAPFILPYMKNRPQTLIRYPNGINGKSFYQKDVTGKVPKWVKKFPFSSERGGKRNFMICTNEADLLLIANLGGLEMHPWSSRADKPDNPDWCIIDLDPSPKTKFDQVIMAAQTTKEVLDALDILSYCKTSGSTGLHIFIPLGAKYSYEQSKEFARIIVTIINQIIPSFTSIERLIENRDEKLYLDFLQNRPQATLAAPYSLRPKPDASVSMPLHWEEVKKGLKISDFTIETAITRAEKEGDLFIPVLGKGINLRKVISRMQKEFDIKQIHKSLQF